MEIVSRPAVRVVCLDPDDRLLLLHWRDEVDGRRLWEPPGGGIEPGEDELAAARRELREETGIEADPVPGARHVLHRDAVWRGRRNVVDEPFLLVRLAAPVEPDPAGFTAEETASYLGHAWLSWPEVLELADDLEPPDLAVALAALHPAGPWA